uniref:Amidase domain-containing protein n=1 Tax=Romanomermis culicivorax TaxID=13658 RepID=A0A915HSY8_ROMCU
MFQSFVYSIMRANLLGLALTVALLSTAGAWALILWSKEKARKEKLRYLLAKKRRSRRENFDRVASNLENLRGKYDKKIVEYSFKELREKLQNEHLTPVEVLWAYQDRALLAQKLTNCVTEFIDEAPELASKLMAKYSGKPKPYLYGVPFSVKECYQLKGFDNTLGLAQFIDHPSLSTSTVVAKMESLGAVPFVRTNLPTTMMSIGSYNPIFGATTNPYDPERRCSGGSSSGEAALLACLGSPLGLGTDIGGSVRTPAHCCGVASLKPTWGRMCQQGRFGLMPGSLAVKGCSGLMARDVDALIECCRALWTDFDYDPLVMPLPFRESMLDQGKSFKIGYYWTDGLLEPVPTCRRALEEARQALLDLGHRVVDFEPLFIEEFYELYNLLITPDNGRRMKEFLDADIEDKVHNGVWFRKDRWTSLRRQSESRLKS